MTIPETSPSCLSACGPRANNFPPKLSINGRATDEKYFESWKNQVCKFLNIVGPSFFIESEKNNYSYNVNQMVISQFQAILPEYKDFKIVRNPINFYKDEYKTNINNNKKIRVGYSPSNVKNRSKWENKGQNRTTLV